MPMLAAEFSSPTSFRAPTCWPYNRMPSEGWNKTEELVLLVALFLYLLVFVLHA